MEIRRCTVAELVAAPNLTDVLDEYARECAIPEIGQAQAQIATYYTLEAAGVFHPIAAFEGEQLAGFILPIVVELPHYGVLAATVESYFVPKAYRPANFGLKLLAAAEELARERGAKALLVSAPVGGALARLMPHLDYRHSNEVYVRALA